MKTFRHTLPSPSSPQPALEHPLLGLLPDAPGRVLDPAEEAWQATVDKVSSGLLAALDKLEVKHGADADQLGLAVATVLGAVLVGHSWTPAAAKETLARLVPVITDLIDSEALHEALEVKGRN